MDLEKVKTSLQRWKGSSVSLPKYLDTSVQISIARYVGYLSIILVFACPSASLFKLEHFCF